MKKFLLFGNPIAHAFGAGAFMHYTGELQIAGNPVAPFTAFNPTVQTNSPGAVVVEAFRLAEAEKVATVSLTAGMNNTPTDAIVKVGAGPLANTPNDADVKVEGVITFDGGKKNNAPVSVAGREVGARLDLPTLLTTQSKPSFSLQSLINTVADNIRAKAKAGELPADSDYEIAVNQSGDAVTVRSRTAGTIGTEVGAEDVNITVIQPAAAAAAEKQFGE